jgi:hypothetical protein
MIPVWWCGSIMLRWDEHGYWGVKLMGQEWQPINRDDAARMIQSQWR